MTETTKLARSTVAAFPEVGIPQTNQQIMAEHHLHKLAVLNCNENPLGTAPKAVEGIRRELNQINRYPESGSTDLRAAIGKHYGLEADNVILSNGGDNIITTMMAAFINEDDELIVGDPSFFVYGQISRIMGGRLVKVPLKDFVYDLDGVLAAVTPKTKMVIICNPNNPTSTIVRQKEVDEFLAKVPDHVLVVMDEAYAEFVSDQGYPNTVEAIQAGKNVLMIRTFSKLYGLAGLRVGYAMAAKPLIANMRKAVETFPVNRLAQAGAIAALDDDAFVQKVIAHTDKSRAYLTEEFSKLGMEVIPGAANFMFVDMKRNSDEMAAELQRRGILIRGGGAWGYPNHCRISFGTMEENQWLMQTIKEIIGA